MVHDIDAIYDHGVLRPVEPLVLPEGTRMHLRVEPGNGIPNGRAKEIMDYDAWVTSLAGRWQGDFERGDEGAFETREPLP